MYLETILRLQQRSANVRSIDIAEELNYSRPSVSKAVGLLQSKGYIAVNCGAIRLTVEGRERAEKVYERHQVLTELFMKMGASKELAEDNACRIEHVVSEELFACVKDYLKKN